MPSKIKRITCITFLFLFLSPDSLALTTLLFIYKLIAWKFVFFSIVTQRAMTSSTSQYTTVSTTGMTELPTTTRSPYTVMNIPPKGTNNNNNKRITSETAENAALIIGIIAGALIAIVLIILIILKFKSRPEVNYKIDEGKSFCQEPNAALLGGAPNTGQPYNSGLKNGQGSAKNGKKRELKDIKEWYV